mgnify:CR=1 FL=1
MGSAPTVPGEARKNYQEGITREARLFFPQTRYKIPVQSCVSSVIVRITVSFAK